MERIHGVNVSETHLLLELSPLLYYILVSLWLVLFLGMKTDCILSSGMLLRSSLVSLALTYSVKRSDVTRNPFQWLLGETNVI